MEAYPLRLVSLPFRLASFSKADFANDLSAASAAGFPSAAIFAISLMTFFSVSRSFAIALFLFCLAVRIQSY